MRNSIWTLWAKALGEKAVDNCDRTSDKVAFIRTFLILQAIVTNMFIVAGIIKHWHQ